MTNTTTGAEQLVSLIEQTIADAHDDELFGNSTPRGVRVLVTAMRAALPHVPRLILGGRALDHVSTITGTAIAAMIAAKEPFDDAEVRAYDPDGCEQSDREQAMYLLGLLVGAQLHANVLRQDGKGGAR